MAIQEARDLTGCPYSAPGQPTKDLREEPAPAADCPLGVVCLEWSAKYLTNSVRVDDPLASLKLRLTIVHNRPSMLQPPRQSCTMPP